MKHLIDLQLRMQDLAARLDSEEDGFSTAELLGNAALGVVALVVIWGALRALGVDIVEMVRGQLLG
jgi:hypothetical protein